MKLKKKKFIIICALSPVAFFFFQYAASPVYKYPEAKVFSGKNWYNPYENLRGLWLKSNFHVHSQSWMNITNGAQSAVTVNEVYQEMGYDVLSLSNYQRISRNPDSLIQIPAYEHGYNMGKTHQIVLGARRVDWYDPLFFQTVNQKQHVINRLQRSGEFIILAHPALQNGYNPPELKCLTGYHAIEVLNHYRTSLKHWDSALSAGRPVWLMGGDDSHDALKMNETGVRWTMIHSPSRTVPDILKALKSGRHLGVRGSNGTMTGTLESLTIEDGNLILHCTQIAREILLIGQDGRQEQTFTSTREAVYELQPDDTYIRAEIQFEGSTVYLNPVIRTEQGLSVLSARVNMPILLIKIFAFGTVCSLLIVLLHRKDRRDNIRKQ